MDDDEDGDEDDDDDDDDVDTIYDFENILNSLSSELKSQEREFEQCIFNMNESINNKNNGNFTSINLWKKYNLEIKTIERDINEFCNDCNLKLNRDLCQHINTKCHKLSQICSNKLNIISDLQHGISCDETEIIHLDKAIRQLTIQKMEYQENIKLKKLEIKKEENLWNLSQKKLKKLQHFNNKYELTKKELNENILNFQQKEKLKIYDIQKHLNHIWKRFELSYQSWNSSEALQWILCIEKFYFSNDKFNIFIDTLKNHQFIGKNLKELRASFTLNVMGLNDYDDQQLLIKNINRIITKSRRKSSKLKKQQHQQIQQALDLSKLHNLENNKSNNKKRHSPPVYNKRKSNRLTKLPEIRLIDIKETNNSNNNMDTSSTDGNLCCICAENEINTVIIPCGHMVYCSKCSKKLTITSCPTCRGKDVKIMTTYKSGL